MIAAAFSTQPLVTWLTDLIAPLLLGTIALVIAVEMRLLRGTESDA